MDSTACNYNPEATADDGSCNYAEEGYNCDGDALVNVTFQVNMANETVDTDGDGT